MDSSVAPLRSAELGLLVQPLSRTGLDKDPLHWWCGPSNPLLEEKTFTASVAALHLWVIPELGTQLPDWRSCTPVTRMSSKDTVTWSGSCRRFSNSLWNKTRKGSLVNWYKPLGCWLWHTWEHLEGQVSWTWRLPLVWWTVLLCGESGMFSVPWVDYQCFKITHNHPFSMQWLTVWPIVAT